MFSCNYVLTELELERKDILAVYANYDDQDKPLQTLRTGRIPHPPVPDGWIRVARNVFHEITDGTLTEHVVAASRNVLPLPPGLLKKTFDPGAALPQQVDAVFDTSSNATWSYSIASVKLGGSIIMCGAHGGFHFKDLFQFVIAKSIKPR
ncbi:hypothetical protein J3F84DRAFT_398965 [Trichoderma pleuroticola]